jgi:copper chaperone CopZ
MRELCIKVAALDTGDATTRITRALRASDGVTAVEVDPSSGWVVTHGHRLHERRLLAAVRAAGFVIQRVSHDSPFPTAAQEGPL